MNTDFIAVEVVRGVAGSMGIILTVPAVSIITAYLLTHMDKCDENPEALKINK